MNEQAVIKLVHTRLGEAGVFDTIAEVDGGLRCDARDVESDAWYALHLEGGTWYAGLYTADRWLSESVEADLEHTGDEIEELIEEELDELGRELTLPVEHFRNEEKVFVFRSRVPLAPGLADDAAAAVLGDVMLAYQAAFYELGDMSGEEED